MADVMEFPKYWEDFIKEYSFKDSGSEFIDVYRVKQMVEHYFSTAAGAMAQAVEKDFRDGNSRVDVSKNGCVTLHRSNKDWIEVDKDGYITQECLDRMNKDIENYNKGIVSEPVDLSNVELEDPILENIRKGYPCEFHTELPTIQFKLDDGAFEPTRAHSTDAGIDIRAKDATVIEPNSSSVFPTGVHVKLPSGTAGLFVSKSGLNVKHGITSTGLIDEGYDGELVAKLYNHTDVPYSVSAGDKITQLVVIPVVYPDISIVNELNQDSERGSDGFGSSGR